MGMSVVLMSIFVGLASDQEASLPLLLRLLQAMVVRFALGGTGGDRLESWLFERQT